MAPAPMGEGGPWENGWANAVAKPQSASILGFYRDNGKSNGNFYSILGLFWDKERERGSKRERESARQGEGVGYSSHQP